MAAGALGVTWQYPICTPSQHARSALLAALRPLRPQQEAQMSLSVAVCAAQCVKQSGGAPRPMHRRSCPLPLTAGLCME